MMGFIGYTCSPHCRRMGLENLDIAFGETKTRKEKCRILRKSLDNFALVTLDLCWFLRDSAPRLERWFIPSARLQKEKSLTHARIGITGHFGNWEMVGRYWATPPGSLMSVAMPIKNTKVDELLKEAREVTGQIVVGREGALKKLIRFLRQDGSIGLLLDQNTAPQEGGIFVEFFGKPVSVSPSAGKLAALTGATVVMAFALPQPDGSYVADVIRRISKEEIEALPRATAAAEITQQITHSYEDLIRAKPEFWLWSYRRWRYVPEGMSADDFPYYVKE
jgi:KDO2-lipid IV(A) lauroyltransferase